VRRAIINRIRLAAIAGCIAIGSLAVAGCGGGSSTTGVSGSPQVSATHYVARLCGALSDWQSTLNKEIASFGQALLPLEQVPGGSFKENKLGAAKNEIRKVYSQLATATQHAATEIKGIGTPDAPHGEQSAAKFSEKIDQIATSMKGLEKKANAVPTSSSKALESALGSLGAYERQRFGQLESQLGSALRTSGSPEIGRLMKQNPTCRSVASR
jgi:hypothetical protein